MHAHVHAQHACAKGASQRLTHICTCILLHAEHGMHTCTESMWLGCRPMERRSLTYLLTYLLRCRPMERRSRRSSRPKCCASPHPPCDLGRPHRRSSTILSPRPLSRSHGCARRQWTSQRMASWRARSRPDRSSSAWPGRACESPCFSASDNIMITSPLCQPRCWRFTLRRDADGGGKSIPATYCSTSSRSGT